MTDPVEELIATGAEALRRGDPARARVAFEGAAQHANTGRVLEGLARTSYLEHDLGQAIAQWEAAYAAHRAELDAVGSVRVARTLGYMNLTIVGNRAVAGGWLGRATTMLTDEATADEAGWVSLNLGMFEPDRVRKADLFRTALAAGRRQGDTDLEFLALAYLGANLVHGDRLAEGMALLDEALAAVAGHDVDDFCVLEEIFCQLFSACEHARDVGRADQWIRIGEAIADRRKLPAVSAFCNTHYGGLLTTAGRWHEADTALTEAARLWGLGQVWLRSGAVVRLADLRVRQGRFEEAATLLGELDGAEEAAAARPRAAVHLANGETALAVEVLERALQQIPANDSAAAPLLTLLVDVHLGAQRLNEAEAAVYLLTALAAAQTSPYLRATAALARGNCQLAASTGDARACLVEALNGFRQAQMPMELAHARLSLAKALVAERPEVALAEARAAFETFHSLQAARYADEAAALLRSLGARSSLPRGGTEGLTRREAEVLDLIALGLSNPEIADRLYISRKTVEHHVGNVLAKLGLRSRGAAASYAHQHKQGGK